MVVLVHGFGEHHGVREQLRVLLYPGQSLHELVEEVVGPDQFNDVVGGQEWDQSFLPVVMTAFDFTFGLGRWGGENEIAKIVLSLIETDFITGECIRVDGGRHIR